MYAIGNEVGSGLGEVTPMVYTYNPTLPTRYMSLTPGTQIE